MIKELDLCNFFKTSLILGVQLNIWFIKKFQRKLFCHCLPSLVAPTARSDYHFERFFRPVLGELGDFDAGMLVEFEKHFEKTFYMIM